MSEIITSDDILGKEAIDPNGGVLGTIIKLHIGNRNKQVIGITIDSGFMKPDLFVGIDYIRHFGIDAVLLNRIPSDKFKGLRVITADGEDIGLVKDISLFRKKLKDITVAINAGLFSKEKVSIPVANISKIGGSVVLKKEFKLEKK